MYMVKGRGTETHYSTDGIHPICGVGRPSGMKSWTGYGNYKHCEVTCKKCLAKYPDGVPFERQINILSRDLIRSIDYVSAKPASWKMEKQQKVIAKNVKNLEWLLFMMCN